MVNVSALFAGPNLNFSGLNFLKKFRFASFLKKIIVLIWTPPNHQKRLFQALQKRKKLFGGFDSQKKKYKTLDFGCGFGEKKVPPKRVAWEDVGGPFGSCWRLCRPKKAQNGPNGPQLAETGVGWGPGSAVSTPPPTSSSPAPTTPRFGHLGPVWGHFGPFLAMSPNLAENCQNRQKWPKMTQNGLKWPPNGQNGPFGD